MSKKHYLLFFSTRIPCDHILEEFSQLHNSKCLNEKEHKTVCGSREMTLMSEGILISFCLLIKSSCRALAALVTIMAKNFLKCETIISSLS